MGIGVRIVAQILFVAAVGGCAPLLRHDAQAVRASIGELYVSQTLDNLGQFIDDPQGVPSLSDLGGGIIEDDTSLSPSATVPFGNQVVTTVIGTAGETITAPSRVFTLGGSVGNKLTINITPVTDPIRLNNAAAIYRYVLDPAALPKPEQTANQRQPLPKTDRRQQQSAAETALRDAIQFPVNINNNDGSVTVPKALLLYPQCILCLKNVAQKKDLSPECVRDPHITEVNKGLGWGWLHSGSARGGHSLGLYHGHFLYMVDEDFYSHGYLRTLVLLVMQAPPPSKSESPPSKS